MDGSVRRVLMARRLAARWVESNSATEYRLRVYAPAGKSLNMLPNLLRSYRDGKVRISGLSANIPDLGIKTGFDHLTLWSSNREGIEALDAWFTKNGCETTGIF
jgi:hypothetical protein